MSIKSEIKHYQLLPMFTLLFILSAQAQITFSGRVLDSESGVPMPFVSIQCEGTSLGTVTNEEGVFHCKIDTLRSKTLRFSFVGYATKILESGAAQNVIVKLDPLPVNLPEMVIHAGHGPLASDYFFTAAARLKKKKDSREARTFLSVITASDQDTPLEVMEGFYQCRTSPARGITDIELKCGRFGLIPLDEILFINDNPTDIIRNLSLVNGTGQDLPLNPFGMKYKEAKKLFRFSIDTLISTGTSALALLRFRPRADSAGLFSGTVLIDTSSFEIQKIVLMIEKATRHPFKPLNKSHSITGLSLKFEMNFRKIDNGIVVFDFILFDYRMNYQAGTRIHSLKSRSLMVFYDYEQPFVIPFYIPAPALSDYGKLLSIPFNPTFWERNYIIPTTSTARNYTAYFQQRGITVNFSESPGSERVIPQKVLYWHPDIHLAWDFIGKKNPGWIAFAESGKRHVSKEDLATRKYFLDFQIFLDVNPEPDTCYWQSRSMLFLDNSFYEHPRDTLALSTFDLEFDIAELYRLRMENQFQALMSAGCNKSDFQHIYNKMVKQFEGMRWLCRKETKRGQNKVAYQTWRKRIDLRLKREEKNSVGGVTVLKF